MFEFQELWHHSLTCISNTQNLSKRMASLNLQSVARCFKTATYCLTVTPALRDRLSNSYLVTKADFWGFNCFWRCSTIVSYVRESSVNNVVAIKSFANWYVSVGRLVNRTVFFCFESLTPLATKKNASCSAYASKSAPTVNFWTFLILRTEFGAVSDSFGILKRRVGLV